MAIEAEAAQQDRAERLAEQRRALPDQPGVYLFRDSRGRVIYVGKAKSIRKRVASHFSQPDAVRHDGADGRDRPHRDARRRHRGRGAAHRAELHQAVQAAVQHPAARRQVVSLHRDQPRRGLPARLLHARAPPARARLLRPVQQRQARARHARPARQDLPVPLLRGPRARPPLRLAVPGLLHQALRGALRRLRLQGGVPRGDRRRDRVPVRAASSRSSATSSSGCTSRAGEQDYEQATLERNRLQAVRALLERQRVADEGAGTYDAVAVAVEGTEANAQVFQVRDGVLSDRQSFYLENQGEQPPAIVAEEFMLQYYASALSIPSLIVVQGELAEGSELEVLGRSSPSAAAARSRSAPPSAAASAGSSTSPSATRGSRSTRRSSRPSAGASSASRRSTACRRRSTSTRCRCGSSASTSPTSAARTPSRRWSCSRAARRRRPITGVSRSARSIRAMITPRWRRSSRAATRSGRSSPSARPTTPSATRRSPRCRTWS